MDLLSREAVRLRRAAFFGGLVGPFALALGVAQAEPPSAWLTRLASYGGIGFLLGWHFDTARGALADANESAEPVVAHQRDTMLALARTAEAKDTDTGEHIQRVQVVSAALARAVGLPEARAAEIGWAAMLTTSASCTFPTRSS